MTSYYTLSKLSETIPSGPTGATGPAAHSRDIQGPSYPEAFLFFVMGILFWIELRRRRNLEAKSYRNTNSFIR